MQRSLLLILSLLISLIMTSCESSFATTQRVKAENKRKTPAVVVKSIPTEQEIIQQFGHLKPTQWGEAVPGVRQRLKTTDRVIALTLDACGGDHGSKYDAKLIELLRKEKIPATLFINRRWIDANPQRFMQLAEDPLFEIENHGTEHRPLSVNGRSIYGIKGTQNVQALLREVRQNDKRIQELTGRSPHFFRSGTAYYDEIAVKIVEALGDQVVNFDIIGDAGATLSATGVKQALLHATSGSIVILHMNQPQGDTAEGLMAALPKLKQKGFRFVKLEQYPLEKSK